MKLPKFARLAGFTTLLFASWTAALGAPGDLKWSYTADAAIRSSPAEGTNGWIIFGTLAGSIYAVNPAAESPAWKTSAGSRVASSAAIAPNGSIYVGSDRGVLALDGLTGSAEWTFKTNEVLSTPTLGTSNMVFCITDLGFAFRLDAASGEANWSSFVLQSFPPDGDCYASPVLSEAGVLLFGISRLYNDPEGVQAVDARAGEALWGFQTINSIQSTPAIGPDGTAYICSFDKNVYALDPATGAQKWSHLTGDSISSSPAIGPDGTIYVGSNDGKLYALDSRTGAEKWTFLTGDTIHSSPAVAADGTVYFGSYDQKVYAVDGRTGEEKWSFATGGLVLSSPLITADGTVYIGSYDGKLYAFEGSAPLAQSSWPMFKGNPRHTGAAVDTMPPRLENPRLTQAGFEMDVLGKPGGIRRIEYTDDLRTDIWTALASSPAGAATNATEQVLDSSAGSSSRARFYRLRVD
jgi:outer membrane protein assembly factor BamB